MPRTQGFILACLCLARLAAPSLFLLKSWTSRQGVRAPSTCGPPLPKGTFAIDSLLLLPAATAGTILAWTSGAGRIWRCHSVSGSAAAVWRSCRAAASATSSASGTRTSKLVAAGACALRAFLSREPLAKGVGVGRHRCTETCVQQSTQAPARRRRAKKRRERRPPTYAPRFACSACRYSFPGGGVGNIFLKNSLRAAKVWMDEYGRARAAPSPAPAALFAQHRAPSALSRHSRRARAASRADGRSLYLYLVAEV